MTVANLWELFNNWGLFTHVRIICVGTGYRRDYTYYKKVLDKWGSSTVIDFSCDSDDDFIEISVSDKLEGNK